MAEYMQRIARPLSMGLALAIFAITTMLFLGQIGAIDWLNILQGEYVFQNTPVVLLEEIGVRWVVGVDALSFPMVWLTAMLIPVSMIPVTLCQGRTKRMPATTSRNSPAEITLP